MMPRYKHDCDECVFVGQFGKYDGYIHVYPDPEHYDNISIIKRFGDEGDYGSMPLRCLIDYVINERKAGKVFDFITIYKDIFIAWLQMNEGGGGGAGAGVLLLKTNPIDFTQDSSRRTQD